MDARSYARSDPVLRPQAPRQLGLSALRLMGDLGRVVTFDLVARAAATVTERFVGIRPTADPSDPSDQSDPPWCQEGGASWTIHGDPSALVGGMLALWVQALHPLALAGVMEHSKFEEDPLGRLRRTGGFVTVTTFGPGSQAERAVETVNRVHDRIHGTAPDGRPYSAHDGELIDWVHCALLLSLARSWLRYGHRPDPDLLDDYVAEQRRVALELGDTDPPSDWSALLEHVESHRPNLAVTSQTRFMDRWLRTPTLSGPLRLALPAHQILHSAALAAAPAWAHELYANRRFLPGRLAGEVLAVGAGSLLARAG